MKCCLDNLRPLHINITQSEKSPAYVCKCNINTRSMISLLYTFYQFHLPRFKLIKDITMVNWWEAKKKGPYAVGMDVLNYDMGNLLQPCKETMDAGADYFHFDVQDGHYGPLISVGSPVVEGIRNHFKDNVIICHMLVLDPIR